MKKHVLAAALIVSISAHPRAVLAGSGSFAQLLDIVAGAIRSAPSVDPQTPAPGQGADITGAYEKVYAGLDRDEDRLAGKLKGVKVLFIPGFLADVTLSSDQAASRHQFEEQMVWLRRAGVECERLSLPSQATIRSNSRLVAAAITASVGPVIIVAHSKGGLDALDALLAQPSLAAKVAGLITLQTPYFGSPLADIVLSSSHLTDIALRALLAVGGGRDVMRELGTAERRAYVAANARDIRALTARVNVVSVATWKDREKDKWDTNLKPLRDMLSLLGIRSDGVVPVDSAILPGSNYVKLSGLDHNVTIRPVSAIPFDRVGFMRALLTLVVVK